MLDLSHVEGIVSRDIPVEVTANGEHGLGHWRRALNGWCVVDEESAKRICAEVLTALPEQVGPIGGVEFRRPLRKKRGHYEGCGAVIVIFGHTRLATLLHELAHHLVAARAPFAKSHGPHFKRAFRDVFLAFGRCAGVNLGAAAVEAEREMNGAAAEIRPGDEVEVNGMLFRVVKKRRVNWLLEPIGGPVCRQARRVVARPEVIRLHHRPKAPAVKVAAEAVKTAAQPDGRIAVGDRMVYRRTGDVWIVVDLPANGKIVCEAAEAFADDPAKFPAGRRYAFGARSLRRV